MEVEWPREEVKPISGQCLATCFAVGSFLFNVSAMAQARSAGPSEDIETITDLRDEYSSEVYCRLQLAEGIELSASAQLIVDPSASDNDLTGIFGLRCRFLY